MGTKQTRHVIGMCGPAGAGKNTAADVLKLVGGYTPIALADPIYAGLSAMLGIPVDQLQDRGQKESPIDWLGESPRRLLQTLGTEWGRDTIRQDIWVTIGREKARRILAEGGRVVFTDVRFDDEAKMIRDDLGGEIWRVHRTPELPGVRLDGTAAGHASESGISGSLVDVTLMNVGGIHLLARQIQDYLSRQYQAV